VGVFYLLVAVTPAIPFEVSAQTAEDLFHQALDDRQAGDFAAAIEKLQQALQLQPENVDFLLLLGQLYGYRESYEEALEVLSHAHQTAPDYSAVTLSIARIHSYQGQYELAESEVQSVIDKEPGNVEAVDLQARLAFYQGDLDRAESGFRQVLELAPDHVESLVGLGDVAMARRERQAAQDYYRRGLEIEPGAPGLRAKLDRATAVEPTWRLDTAIGYSRFGADGREPWRENFNRLSYRVTPSTTIHGGAEISERFGLTDVYYEGGIEHEFTEWLYGDSAFGGTPSPDFRERWAARVNGAVRISQGGRSVGGTVLSLQTKFAEYDTGNVETLNPGIEQYFADGRLWLTGRWINTLDETGEHLIGWLGRLDFQATDTLRVYGGLSNAPETQGNTTLDTRSAFAGVIIDVTSRVAIRADLLYEDREGSSSRVAIFSGLSLSF
jgi:YaiO family outer membrane protein